MSQDLVPLIGACATWLDRSFGPGASPLQAVLAQVQTRQAVTVAAWLRYPTPVDAALTQLVAPRGAQRLTTDALSHGDTHALSHGDPAPAEPDQAWHSWLDVPVVSWAACLLLDGQLARTAVLAATRTEHAQGLALSFRSLLEPDEREARASALLRHPDLLGPIADLHRGELLTRLGEAAGA